MLKIYWSAMRNSDAGSAPTGQYPHFSSLALQLKGGQLAERDGEGMPSGQTKRARGLGPQPLCEAVYYVRSSFPADDMTTYILAYVQSRLYYVQT